MKQNQEVNELADLLGKVLNDIPMEDIPLETRQAMARDLLIRFNDNKSGIRGALRWILTYKLNGWMPPEEN